MSELLIYGATGFTGKADPRCWRQHNVMDLGDADYLRMILKKTCWYTTIYPCRVGALIGTRDGRDLNEQLRFGFFLGAAFQIQDDLLNLVSDHARYGKEIGGDLWEGKRTLMLINLFEKASPVERIELRRILRLERGQRTTDDVGWIRELDAHGCIGYARQVAHGLAGAARHEFRKVYAHLPDSRDKQFLESLVPWVLERV